MLSRTCNRLFTASSSVLLNAANTTTGAAAAAAASSSAAVAGSSSSAAAAPTSVPNERIANIFANRRNPTNLFQPGMHSGTLSDHPITLKVAKDEIDYRQRKLIERGDYERAADAEIESERHLGEHRDGIKETNEYRWVLFFVTAGYFSAHLIVYSYYYPDDMRLPYDPEKGYVDVIEKKKMQLESIDEMVGVAVLKDVVSTKRAVLKQKAQRHWVELSGAAE